MTQKKGQPADDVSSAPESGTVCDDTSGNQPSDRNNQQTGEKTAKDDPSHAGEEP